MIKFVIAYVVVAVIGFVIFLVSFLTKRSNQKYNSAAEKIIRDDLLRYSLKNPYSMTSREKPPTARRMMIGLSIKAAGKRHRYVFDPAKRIDIGSSDKSQIIIFDSSVSRRQACICTANGAVCAYNTGSRCIVSLKRGAIRKIIRPGNGVRLKDGDKLMIRNYKIKIKLFIYDMNHK